MTTSTATTTFYDALRADGPAEGLQAAKLMTYGQLVGDWNAQVVDYRETPARHLSGEVHVDWILEGRAIQDVWIAPARGDRKPGAAPSGINWYGTTLRIYDPKSDSWRISWFNPQDGTEVRLLGRVVGEEIVQEGTLDGDIPVRWIFSELEARSCRWRCEISSDERKTWKTIISAELERAEPDAFTDPLSRNGSEVERLVEQLRLLHQGEAWHGPSVREAVDGVTAAAALSRPIGAAHTIREIVHHIRVNDDGVRRRLNGESPGEDPDWPSDGKLTDAVWRKELEQLEATQAALRDAVGRLSGNRLFRTMPGKQHSYWHEVLGIIQHAAYHAGQVSVLKKGG